MSIEEIEQQVVAWADARGILMHSDSKAQTLKAVSEMGELADAIIKGDCDETVDAIGDVMVCLTNLCAMNGWNLHYCYARAWNAIKHRTGKMSANGAFVKDEEVQQ
jgi:NTP pyrophosphatase (non-canonical NTP hydrolase)